ncbi:unnamed protein product, partial [Musa acuminata var. zebrina]
MMRWNQLSRGRIRRNNSEHPQGCNQHRGSLIFPSPHQDYLSDAGKQQALEEQTASI